MKTLQHRFVEFMPSVLEEGILYVSIEYSVAVHKCVCGCGNKVVTPLSPTDWKLSYNGETISLTPSIGNWQFECESHYWIINNTVKHARKWSKTQIEEGRNVDIKKKKKYFKKLTK